MDEAQPVVACANGYQFRAPAPVFMLEDQTLSFGNTPADGEYVLTSAVPRATHQANVLMQPIHQMPLCIGAEWIAIERVIYTGHRRVILEVVPGSKNIAEITVPPELQKNFRCYLDDAGIFFLEAQAARGHQHSGSDGSVYGGDHIDMRNTVINGGVFVAKTVTYDAHGNRSETVVGLQPSTITLRVPHGVAVQRHEDFPSAAVMLDRPLRFVD